MPGEVLAYLRWLAHIDTSRLQLDSQAQASMVKMLPQMLSPTSDIGVDTSAPGPEYAISREFQVWKARLEELRARFSGLHGSEQLWAALGGSAPPRVPQPCTTLHGLYGQVLDTQIQGAAEVASAMATKNFAMSVKSKAAGSRANELLQRADAEFGAICSQYGVHQFYQIRVTPGQASVPPLLPP